MRRLYTYPELPNLLAVPWPHGDPETIFFFFLLEDPETILIMTLTFHRNKHENNCLMFQN